ncbi:aminotransferase class I/II-fold pyridoxal phosphate-dependent enzyme [Sphaerisporangium sp. NBC_01403]|uniref:pyridoxal phosphate-dependent aminotransferase n=1 Tax=Sphaerisporangium sp. NBC_01403 TaxID=2903599 RepID=UPI003246507C
MAGSTDLNPLRSESPSYSSLARGGSGPYGAPADFRVPRNPYFPTPEMSELLGRKVAAALTSYPGDAGTVAAELSAVLGLNARTVVMGNGSAELIAWIDHLLVRESLAVPIPASGRWTGRSLETGKRVDMFPLQEAEGFALDVDAYVRFVRKRGSRVAVVCNPGDPDGGYLPRAQVGDLLDRLSDLDLVIVDESSIDFVDAERSPSVADEAAIRPNVIVLRSLTGNFGLHGIRLAYLVANPALAGKVRRMLPRGSLSSFAEPVVHLLREHAREYQDSLRLVAADRRSMLQRLSALPGLTVYPSQANFLLVRLPEGKDGAALCDHLRSAHDVLVRDCGDKLGSSGRFLRLAVAPRQDAERLVDALHSSLFSVGNGRAAAAIGAAPSPQAGTAYVMDSYAATPYYRDPTAPSSYQRELPAAPSYQGDPFVVGSDDPRHGRLDPLDTTSRWTFDANTSPFSAVRPRYDGGRP